MDRVDLGGIKVESWVGSEFPRPTPQTDSGDDPTAGARRRHTPTGIRDSKTATQTLAPLPEHVPSSSPQLLTPYPAPRSTFPLAPPTAPASTPLAARVLALPAYSPSSTSPHSLPFPAPSPLPPILSSPFPSPTRPSSLPTVTCPLSPAVRPPASPLLDAPAPASPTRAPRFPSRFLAPLPQPGALPLSCSPGVFSSPLPAKFRGCQSVSLSGRPHRSCGLRAPLRAELSGTAGVPSAVGRPSRPSARYEPRSRPAAGSPARSPPPPATPALSQGPPRTGDSPGWGRKEGGGERWRGKKAPMRGAGWREEGMGLEGEDQAGGGVRLSREVTDRELKERAGAGDRGGLGGVTPVGKG